MEKDKKTVSNMNHIVNERHEVAVKMAGEKKTTSDVRRLSFLGKFTFLVSSLRKFH